MSHIGNYWIPRYKWQMVEWMKKNRPEWGNMAKYSKNELYAVWYKIMNQSRINKRERMPA